MITGFLLSLDAPSETSVALCVAQALLPKEELLLHRKLDAEWPVWGFPDVIHVDNAGEFRSDNFKKSCKAHGIDLQFRPVKRPNYGGHIERLIGTFMTEVHTLPGTTFSSPSQKGDLDPDKHAALTFSEFNDWLFEFVCNVYHRKLHSMIGTTPFAQWEKGVLGSADQPGAGLPPRPDNPTAILRDFLPRFERTVQRAGISIDGVGYYADTLRHWINAADPKDRRRKRKFLFRRDPRDISKIWFHDPEAKQYFEVPAADRRFPQTNVWELKEAKREMKREGEKATNPKQLRDTLNRLCIHTNSGRLARIRVFPIRPEFVCSVFLAVNPPCPGRSAMSHVRRSSSTRGSIRDTPSGGAASGRLAPSGSSWPPRLRTAGCRPWSTVVTGHVRCSPASWSTCRPSPRPRSRSPSFLS